MSRLTKQTLSILFSLAILSIVVAGGMIIYNNFKAQPEVLVFVPQNDPENQVDQEVFEYQTNIVSESIDEEGIKTVRFAAEPIKYLEEGTNIYNDIDTTIVEATSEQYDYENTTNIYSSYFNNEILDDSFITYQAPGGDRKVEFTYIDANTSEWSIDKDQAVYANIYDGIDLHYTVTTISLIEELLISDKETALAIEKIDQAVNITGMYYKERDDGSISLHDNETKNIVMIIPRPVMYGTGDDVANINYGLHYEIVDQEDNSIIISKVIDESGYQWLSEATYPLVIDNSYIAPVSLFDIGEVYRYRMGITTTYTSTWYAGVPRTGSYTGTTLQSCGSCDVAHYDYQNHLSFYTGTSYQPADLTGNILGAKLTMYMNRSSGATEYPEGENIRVYSGIDEWGDFSVTPASDIWNAKDVMTDEGLLDTTGLAAGPSSFNCLSPYTDCQRDFLISASSICDENNAGNCRTHIITEATTSIGDGFYNGVYTKGNATVGTRPVLEVYYEPMPDMEITRGYCSNNRSQDCVQDSNCAGTCNYSHDNPNQHWVRITDNTVDENYWEIRWANNSSFVGEQIRTGINTGAAAGSSCGADCTYTCDNTSKASTGGTCIVSVGGLISDTEYYVRGRTYRGDPPAGSSPFSSTDSDMTPAAVQNDTSLIISSPRWDSLSYTNCLNLTTIVNPTSPNGGTDYNIGFSGNWSDGSGWRFASQMNGAVDILAATSYTPYYLLNYGYANLGEWIWNAFGISCSNSQTATGATILPDEFYFIGEWSRDTRSSNYSHEPTTSILNAGTITRTRARNPLTPSPVVIDDSSLTLNMNRPINPDNNAITTKYAMQVQVMGGGWSSPQYLSPAGGTGRYGSAFWGTAAQWDTNTTYGGFDSNECYDFRAKSMNSEGIEGEDESASEWSAAGVSSIECTKPVQPAIPTVACDYNTTNNYHCNFDINDPNNPITTEYRVQYSYSPIFSFATTTGWDYDNDPATSGVLMSGMENHLCSTIVSRDTYYYRVQARHDAGQGIQYSDWSDGGSDTLPPCRPGTPQLGGFIPSSTSISWYWTAAVSAEGVDRYNVYDNEALDGFTPNGIAPTNFNPYILTTNPNTPHILSVEGVDRIASREGQRSLNSVEVYTLANNPEIEVDCSWDATNGNNCNVTLISHNNNVISSPPEYCLSRKNSSVFGGWEYYRVSNNTWSFLNSFICWSEAYTTYDIGWQFPSPDNEMNFSEFTCGTEYTYRMQARNDNDDEAFPLSEVKDTTPLCPPTNLRHTNNFISGSNYYLTVNWNSLVMPPVDYPDNVLLYNNVSCTGIPYRTLLYNDIVENINYGASPNILKEYCIRYIKDGEYSQPGTGDSNAYTAIQPPTGINFSNIGTNSITARYTGTLTRLGVLEASLYYRSSYTNGGGGENPYGWTTGSHVDSGLAANYNYCYQVMSRNSEPGTDATGDRSSYRPTNSQGACTYTLAEIPKRPIREQVDALTVNIKIIEADGNPHGEGISNDTEYAICATEYTIDGSILRDGYVQNDNSVAWLLAGEECGDKGDSGVIWKTWSNWGDIAGVDITGVASSTKFGFSVKAVNGDRVETNFGPEATLFLVKNNVVGWAWSSNIGWVSMNCLNLFSEPDRGYSCKTADNWGINTSFEPTREINPLEGYAWSASGQSKGAGICSGGAEDGKTCFSDLDCDLPGICLGDKSVEIYTTSTFCGDDPLERCDADNPCSTGSCVEEGNTVAIINDNINDEDDYLWMINSNNQLRKYHAESMQSSAVSASFGAGLNDVLLDDDGYVWVTSTDEDMLYKFDPIDLSIVDTVTLASCNVDGQDAGDQPECTPGSLQNLNDGTIVVINNERNNDWSTASRIRTSDGLELNCDGTEPSTYPEKCGVCSNSAYTDELTCVQEPQNHHWGLGRKSGHSYYDSVTQSVYVNNGYESTVARINFSTSPEGEVTRIPFHDNYFGASDFVRMGSDLFVIHSTYVGHLGYCTDDNSITCTLDTDCGGGSGFPAGVCTDVGEAGTGAISILDTDIIPNSFIGSSTQHIDSNGPAGSTTDGRSLWISGWYGNGVCANDNTLYCSDKGYSVSGTCGPTNYHWSCSDNSHCSAPGDTCNLSYDGICAIDDSTPCSLDSHCIAVGGGLCKIDMGGRCENDVTIGCNNDENCTPVGGICLDDDCNSVGGGCINVTTRVFQVDPSTGITLSSYQVAPSDWNRSRNIIHNNNFIWALSYSGYLAKIPDQLDTVGVTAGLGWISLNKSVCSDDAQQGCTDDSQCEGIATCDESADVTPDATTYGFCYNDTASNNGEKYGVCSDDGSDCTETDVTSCDDPLTANCILETCQTSDICPVDALPGIEECRDTATAYFNGETREIEGWARILSMKEQGIATGFTDWGWLQLGGQYDDGQGNTGDFNLTGTEIDSQLFLGDPDVSAEELSLYTFFGWGWNADISDYIANSDWLPTTNVSNSSAARLGLEGVHNTDMVLDSNGDPHIAWEVYDRINNYSDIYYLKLEAGKWITVSGVEYQPGAIDPIGSMLSIGHGAGFNDIGRGVGLPSLDLGADNRPHLAGIYNSSLWSGSTGDGGDIFYTVWNGSDWTLVDGVTPGYDHIGGTDVDGDQAQTPTLKLNESGMPNIVYRSGSSWPGEIYFKIWDGRIWNTIGGTIASLNVSKTIDTSSTFPELIIDGDTPHVIYRDLGLVYYRWWDAEFDNGDGTFGAWVTVNGDLGPNYYCSQDLNKSCTVGNETVDCETFCASDSDNPGIACSVDADCGNDAINTHLDQCLSSRCQSEDIAVNWGLSTCDGTLAGTKCYDDDDCGGVPLSCQRLPNIEPGLYGVEAASFDLYDNSTPGVLFRGSTGIYYRMWNGANWVSVSGALDATDLVISDGYGRATRDPYVVIGDDNYPRVIWGEHISGYLSDITYKQWDGSDWVTIDGNPAAIPPDTGNQSAYISDTSTVQSYSPTTQLDRFGNPHVLWSEINYSGYDCGEFGSGGVINGIDGEIHDIEIDYDNNVVYLVGVSDDDGAPHWRIDKRRFDTGDLITDFGWNENEAVPVDTNNGFIVGDTNSLAVWNIELDIENNEFYVVGEDNNGNWRLEKRNMDSGDRVSGFGNNDDTDWPANPAGVVRLDNGNAINGVDLKIDDKYIYIVGRDDNNDWRIEKRLKTTGSLFLNFGANGVIISADGDDTRKILIDHTYMWISGHDDNADWRIEKRLLSNGELVSSFGNGGVFNGPSSNPDSDSVFDILIDNDDIYAVGKTTDNHWLTAKLDKNTGILNDNFGVDGYVETSYASAVNFIYGIEMSGDDIIIAGSLDNAWHYEIRNKDTGDLNTIDETSGWQNGLIDSAGNLVWGIDSDDDYVYLFGNDDSNNWRLERRWKSNGTFDNRFNDNRFNDCKDPKYPMCVYVWPSHECAGGDIFYSRWTPGVVQGGIGWVEFMPAGALLGIPWVQTAYADIFGTEGVSLAPPPRGSGKYTATYLILSNGNIEGIPTYYYGDSSEQPNTQFYEGGLNPLIEGSSLPFGENALSKINVDALAAGPDFNRYGHPLEINNATNFELDVELGNNINLNGKVYYFNDTDIMDSVSIQINEEITFTKGDSTTDPETSGNGLIVIDGDLEINANIYYDTTTLNDIAEMPSVGFIVRGNIYISPFVTEISGAFVALDNPNTPNISEGIISTSRKNPIITSITDADSDAYVSFDSSHINHNLISPNDESLKFGNEVTTLGNYEFRMQATFNPPSITNPGIESNVPIMIKINNDPEFAHFWTNLTDTISGHDINFADEDGTPLDFHIEKFNYDAGTPANNEIVAWVQISMLDTISGTDHIWMYYSRPSPISQQNETGAFDNDYVGVWHLDESSGDRHNSTSTLDIDAVPVGLMSFVDDGIAAGADKFDGLGGTIGGSSEYGYCFEGFNNTNGSPLCNFNTECDSGQCVDSVGGSIPGGCEVPDPTGSYLEIPKNVLSGEVNFTIEAWIRPTTLDRVVIVQQRDDVNDGGGSYTIVVDNGTDLSFSYWKNPWPNPQTRFSISESLATLSDGQWHHVAVTIDNTNDEALFYIDGVGGAPESMTEIIDIDGENSTFVGVDYSQIDAWACNKIDAYYNGDIDEVRISDTVRSPEYINATYLAERDSGSFITWGIPDPIENRTDRAFLRFEFGPSSDNDILPNSEIRSAHLNLFDDGGSSNGAFEAKIYLIDFNDVYDFTDTASGFPIAADLFNVNVSNGMTYSLDSTTWDSTVESKNISIDIKSLIQRYVNSDEYGQSYADGDITHLGLVIQEGDADVGDFRSFYSREGSALQAEDKYIPELVVEYSPRRTYYDLLNQVDDIASTAFGFDTIVSPLNVGWLGEPSRIFYRFLPGPLYTSLPDNTEVLEAHLRLNNSAGKEFEIRQGLLRADSMTNWGSSNPYNLSMTQDVFEVGQELDLNEGATGPFVLRDISTLIQSWLDPNNNYNFGEGIGLRLRRDNNTNEKIPGVDEYRVISQGGTTLEVDYLVPLQVSGLFVARGYNFDRKYTKDLAPAERIVYDGRVVANTPPGLADFSKALPIYQRVAP